MRIKKFIAVVILALGTSGVVFADQQTTDDNINSPVENKISTNSQQPMTDAAITTKVKSMFIHKKLFGDKDVAAITIGVETINGVVMLSGTADNQNQINNAIKIAKSVEGVKSVKSTVKISN